MDNSPEAGFLAGLLDIVNRGGVVGLLIAILVGGFKKWWVWGHQLIEMKEDRDYWRNMATHQLNINEKAAEVGEKIVAHTTGG